MIHVFQAFPGSMVPEADQSIAAVGLVPGRGSSAPSAGSRPPELTTRGGVIDMQEFRGKTAVVTGAGSGIGRALALGFAAEGMRVAMADIDADDVEASAALVRGGVPTSEVAAEVCDVSDAEPVERLADSVFDRWGQVDVVCNNAGVFVGGLIWDRPAADFEFVLGANLWGILNGIRAFVPRMIAQGTEGHVVNTASVAGLFGAPFEAPYAISKFAAFAATESLAHDLQAVGSSIKASVLCPGMITTNIVDSDRHRPGRLATEVTEDQKFVTDYLAQAVADGMDPDRGGRDGHRRHPSRAVPDPDPRLVSPAAGRSGPGPGGPPAARRARVRLTREYGGGQSCATDSEAAVGGGGTMKGYVLTVERMIRAAPEAIFDVLSDAAKHSLIDGSGMLQGTATEAPDRLAPVSRSGWE